MASRSEKPAAPEQRGPFPPIQIPGPFDRANHIIGLAMMILSGLLVLMMAVQFVRSYLNGCL